MTANDCVKTWFIECSKAGVAGAPIPVAALFGHGPNLYWALVAYVLAFIVYAVVCFGRFRHLERIEEKKNEEAEKKRASDREIIEKLLAHSLETNQSIIWEAGNLRIQRAQPGERIRRAVGKTRRPTRCADSSTADGSSRTVMGCPPDS